MPLERSRQLIGGVWRYVSAQQSDNGGSGSQTFPINVPVAFDMPGLFPQAFPITAVDVDPANEFTIAGDHVALFPVGGTLTVFGSSGNDGPHEILGVALDGGNTVITVDGSVSDPTVDGDIYNTGTAGIVAYTPTPGDVVFPVGLIITESFDGNSPTLYITSQGDPLGENFGGGTSNLTQTTPDTDGHNFQGSDPGTTSPVLMVDTAPLIVTITDGSGAAPGSTMGAGVLALLAIPA
jgi:hypothetical protein